MKILLITPYLPAFELVNTNPYVTKFAFIYAKEWAEQGHEVVILHCIPKFPDIFYSFIALLNKFKNGKSDLSVYENDKSALKQKSYKYENVRIIRIPITKYLPHREYFKNSINRFNSKALSGLNKIDFIPNVVFADYFTPSGQLSNEFNKIYSIPYYIILHKTDRLYYNKYKSQYHQIIENSKGILHRSYVQQNLFHNIGCKHKNENLIFSGIPNDTTFGEPREIVRKLIYAGALKRSKNIHLIIEVLNQIDNKELTLDILGDGPYRNELENLSRKNMREADCFIMISKETFGMVYIEAMSQGCITVGVKDEGIDGIIIDGVNGFLVESINKESLAEILNKISNFNQDELHSISSKAITTATKFQDRDLARNLLEKLSESKNTFH